MIAKTPLDEMKQLHLALIACPDFETDGPLGDAIRDRMDGCNGPYRQMTDAERDEYGRWQCEVERGGPDKVCATCASPQYDQPR